MTIITNFDYPPIPVRSFDWSAVLDGYGSNGRGGVEYVIIGEHHLCRFNVGWKDGPHGAAFNHLREAFKSVKGGKE
jgi:hypothetical protein